MVSVHFGRPFSLLSNLCGSYFHNLHFPDEKDKAGDYTAYVCLEQDYYTIVSPTVW